MKEIKIHLCDYGCGQEAKYQFKNGKWCCSKSYNSCPELRKKMRETRKGENHPRYGKIGYWKDKKRPEHSKIMRGKNHPLYGKHHSEKTRKKQRESRKGLIPKNKLTIERIKKLYLLFSKIEEIRHNPNNLKEIQVHCKNHNCKNSKEKGGWFTTNTNQLYHRIQTLENPKGFGESNFYCSQKCKDTCILYRSRSDPYKDINLPYTYTEYQTFRTFVLERDNYICQFCGNPATDVHHERPQKLEPFFSLDPDYAWSCCKKCHYKKGHKDECSTGNLAKIVCSVESQKFLNQKLVSNE